MLRYFFMGGVPIKHHSKSKVGRRRAHLALKPAKILVCLQCRGPVMPHKACKQCGSYVKPQRVSKGRKDMAVGKETHGEMTKNVVTETIVEDRMESAGGEPEKVLEDKPDEANDPGRGAGGSS